MNQSAGKPRPRSWKDTKLTMYPTGGLGSGSPNGATHSGLSGLVIGRRRPASTSAYSISTDASERPQGSAWRILTPAIGAVENTIAMVRRALDYSFPLSLFSPLPTSSRRSPLLLANARRQRGRLRAKKVRRGRAVARRVFIGERANGERRNRKRVSDEIEVMIF